MKTKQRTTVELNDFRDITEEQYILIACNSDVNVRMRLRQNTDTAFIVVERKYVINHFSEWKKKYKLIIEKDKEYNPDEDYDDVI